MTTHLNTTAAAALLQLSPRTLRRMVLQGNLSATREGTKLQFTPDDLTPLSVPDGPLTDRLLTVPEAAAYLRISTTTVRQLIRQGSIPAAAVTGSERRRWRFNRQDLDDWLAKQRTSQPIPSTPAQPRPKPRTRTSARDIGEAKLRTVGTVA
jgi:excisionase family DNA binding protein